MDVIKGEAIDGAVKEKGRIYLCGDLEFPNGVEHIPTAGYEIGVSYYPVYTFEKPHIHAFNTEYNYVLEGELKILLIREGRVVHLKKGDLFVIYPDEPYVGKSLPGTKTLFSKDPGGNDKVVVPMTPAIQSWGGSWEAEYIPGGDEA